MDAGLNVPEDHLEIVEPEFNDDKYFQVLACPELGDNNEHQYGVAISKTKRTYLASSSRTELELINNNTTQSDDSGSLVSDRTDTNRTKQLAPYIKPVAPLTKLRKSDVADEFNSKSKSPPAQPSSDVSNIKHQLKNKSSKTKSVQSTSSSIFHGKTGSGNLIKVNISESSLKVSARIDNRQKNHKCNICEKAFTRPDHLENHIRMHTGEKPFNCLFCTKTFSMLCHVKEHERIHTGERPFKCSFCEKAFCQSSNLKSHERIHTGETPFKCSYCSKGYSRLKNVRKHERIHTEEGP